MIYVTGDLHGEEELLYRKEIKSLDDGDTLLICGDFGFVWDNSSKEKKLLKYLGSRRYNIAFVDGTHENYDLLSRSRMTVWNGGRVHRISENLFHLMRGEIFKIEGKSFFAFGGGESHDREMRIEHKTWWREEMPSPDEMANGAQNLDDVGCKVDYIITHEPPSIVKSAMLLRAGENDSVNKLNGFFEQINTECTFTRWYFGSMHEDKIITRRHTAVFREVLEIE